MQIIFITTSENKVFAFSMSGACSTVHLTWRAFVLLNYERRFERAKKTFHLLSPSKIKSDKINKSSINNFSEFSRFKIGLEMFLLLFEAVCSRAQLSVLAFMLFCCLTMARRGWTRRAKTPLRNSIGVYFLFIFISIFHKKLLIILSVPFFRSTFMHEWLFRTNVP